MQTSSSSAGTNKPSTPKLWRIFGLALVGLALLATASALFYIEENWRGKSDWQAYQLQAEARGVEFDFNKFIPPAVPDEQNFAMTPFLAPLLDLKPRPFNGTPYNDQAGFDRATKFAANFKKVLDEYNKTAANPGEGQPFDLVTFAMALEKTSKSPPQITPDSTRMKAGYTVLQNMDSFKPVLDELRAASQRPYARFNVHYDDEDPAGILLPHLAVLKKVAQLFCVRASAELAVGKTDSAFADTQMIFYLADSMREEPILISYLVRLAILKYAQQTIWEGLAAHAWSDAQLQDFQTHAEKFALLKELKTRFNNERATFGTRLFELMRNRPGYIRNITEDKEADQAALAYAPNGWLYLEQVSYYHYFDNQLLPGFDADGTRIYPEKIDAAALNGPPTKFDFPGVHAPNDNVPNENATSRLLHHRVLMHLLAGSLPSIFLKAALGQTGMDEANVACALERYRLANDKLPDTLDLLVPKFLTNVPIDVCNGNPLIYHPKGGGAYQLYSVGWNETDDSGAIVLDETSNNPPHLNPRQGDWVWPEFQ